jgi:hypothetical protein
LVAAADAGCSPDGLEQPAPTAAMRRLKANLRNAIRSI